MLKPLTVYINDQPAYEHDRELSLDDSKLEFLDKMDTDMQRGIKIRGELITEPDNEQRVRFVAMNLIKALQQDNHAIISVSCAYLIHRRPELIEIHVHDRQGHVDIDFVDEPN